MNLPFGIRISRQTRKPEKERAPAAPQTREPYDHPFTNYFNEYQPLKSNIQLFRTIREGIPFVNIGILKRNRLIGNFEYDGNGNSGLKELLDDFKKYVQVNWFSKGLDSFVAETTDSARCDGMGIAEIVPTRTLSDIHHLKTCNSTDFRFMYDKEKKRVVLGVYKANEFKPVPLENMDLITYLAFDQRRGHPQGYSMIYSLPFVSQILLRMEKSWENATWRVGDPTFVTVITGGEGQPSQDVNKMADSIESQFANVMKLRRQGQTADVFGAVPYRGRVDIKTLGADGEVIVDEIPVRTILEQVVAQIGLPPYMLGISWSTTERMSKDQADMIVGDVNWERDRLEHIIRKVTDMFLILNGKAGAKWKMKWNEVNLLDEENQAKAKLWNAQAAFKMIEATALALGYGWMDDQDAEDFLRREGIIKGKLPAGWYQSFKGRQFVKELAKEYVNGE